MTHQCIRHTASQIFDTSCLEEFSSAHDTLVGVFYCAQSCTSVFTGYKCHNAGQCSVC